MTQLEAADWYLPLRLKRFSPFCRQVKRQQLVMLRILVEVTDCKVRISDFGIKSRGENLQLLLNSERLLNECGDLKVGI